MQSKPKRGDRVAERLRAEIMDLLLRGAVRDPEVRDVIVTVVRVSADLRHARVYVRLLEPARSEAQKQAVVAGLTRASSYIRREIAPKLKLKYQPELKFFWDEGLDQASRIEALLDEVRSESKDSA